MEELKGRVGQEGEKGEKGILGVLFPKERGEILDKAKAIINGARQDQYGNPESSFTIISEFWTVYMTNKQKRPDALLGFIGRKDVALMMALMKIAREMNGAGKEDNMIDAAGYIALAADMSNYEEKKND